MPLPRKPLLQVGSVFRPTTTASDRPSVHGSVVSESVSNLNSSHPGGPSMGSSLLRPAPDSWREEPGAKRRRVEEKRQTAMYSIYDDDKIDQDEVENDDTSVNSYKGSKGFFTPAHRSKEHNQGQGHEQSSNRQISSGGSTLLHRTSKASSPSTSQAAQISSSSWPTSSSGTQQLIPINRVHPSHRAVFRNYEYFNPVQSECFAVCYESDDNYIVSAPTGCGKTVLFELAILRLFYAQTTGELATSNHPSSTYQLTDPKRPRNSVKAIYICPLKALCHEKAVDWEKKFSALGMRVLEVTGDTQEVELYQLEKADLILSTPEKWDSMTRRWNASSESSGLMNSIGLVMIDEIHVLGEPRGGCLEGCITRYKMMKRTYADTVKERVDQKASSDDPPLPPVATVRFVAMSATIPNYEDIAKWLEAKGRYFGPEYRPVPLQVIIKDYPPNKSAFHFANNLNYRVFDIIAEHSGGRPTLVFCATRGECIKAAQEVAKSAKLRGRSVFVRDQMQMARLSAASRGIKHKGLAEVITSGVAIHTAALELKDRTTVEQLFLKGDIQVLCTTSTLAQGVNLPAHLVIVKGTQFYSRGTGYTEYLGSNVVQMMGRAGRPQFDTSAKCVIMTQSTTRRLYEHIEQSVVESNLTESVTEHLNAELVLGTVKSAKEAKEWISSTYLAIRKQGGAPTASRAVVTSSSPTLSCPISSQTSMVVQTDLETLVMSELERLKAAGMCIEHIPDPDVPQEQRPIMVEKLGEVMARYYLRFHTCELMTKLPPEAGLKDVVNLLAEVSEYHDMQIRLGEKSVLNRLNKVSKGQRDSQSYKGVRFPISTSLVTTSADKVKILLQASLDPEAKIADFQLKLDCETVLQGAQRVMAALVEYLSGKSAYKALHSSFILRKSCQCRLWVDYFRADESTPVHGYDLKSGTPPSVKAQVFLQFEGIGAKYCSNLVNAGITTIEELEQVDAVAIDNACGRSEGFGKKLKVALEAVPRYELEANVESSTSKGGEMVAKITARQIKEGITCNKKHKPTATILIGDSHNELRLVRTVRWHDQPQEYSFTVTLPLGRGVVVDLIDKTYASIDRRTYAGAPRSAFRFWDVPSVSSHQPKGKGTKGSNADTTGQEESEPEGEAENTSTGQSRTPHKKQAGSGTKKRTKGVKDEEKEKDEEEKKEEGEEEREEEEEGGELKDGDGSDIYAGLEGIEENTSQASCKLSVSRMGEDIEGREGWKTNDYSFADPEVDEDDSEETCTGSKEKAKASASQIKKKEVEKIRSAAGKQRKKRDTELVENTSGSSKQRDKDEASKALGFVAPLKGEMTADVYPPEGGSLQGFIFPKASDDQELPDAGVVSKYERGDAERSGKRSTTQEGLTRTESHGKVDSLTQSTKPSLYSTRQVKTTTDTPVPNSDSVSTTRSHTNSWLGTAFNVSSHKSSRIATPATYTSIATETPTHGNREEVTQLHECLLNPQELNSSHAKGIPNPGIPLPSVPNRSAVEGVASKFEKYQQSQQASSNGHSERTPMISTLPLNRMPTTRSDVPAIATPTTLKTPSRSGKLMGLEYINARRQAEHEKYQVEEQTYEREADQPLGQNIPRPTIGRPIAYPSTYTTYNPHLPSPLPYWSNSYRPPSPFSHQPAPNAPPYTHASTWSGTSYAQQQYEGHFTHPSSRPSGFAAEQYAPQRSYSTQGVPFPRSTQHFSQGANANVQSFTHYPQQHRIFQQRYQQQPSQQDRQQYWTPDMSSSKPRDVVGSFASRTQPHAARGVPTPLRSPDISPLLKPLSTASSQGSSAITRPPPPPPPPPPPQVKPYATPIDYPISCGPSIFDPSYSAQSPPKRPNFCALADMDDDDL